MADFRHFAFCVRLHGGCSSEVIAFWARVLHTEKKYWGSEMVNCYSVLPDNNWSIWKICYIVGIHSVILFIFANLLAFFLSAFFEVIFISPFTLSGFSPNVRKTEDLSSWLFTILLSNTCVTECYTKNIQQTAGIFLLWEERRYYLFVSYFFFLVMEICYYYDSKNHW